MNQDNPDQNADQGLSAYERAAQDGAADPRCVPVRLDGPVPEGSAIEVPDYPDVDHETWRILYDRQMELLPGRACRDYLEGQTALGLGRERIPALRDLGGRLEATSGWNVARIPGLLHEEDFFGLLARRRFPTTDYIRQRHELDYTPAPDMFHDIFGHMPMITNPSVAAFYEEFGKIAGRARGSDRRCLERFYWFTVEFGLVHEAGELRVYGSGILSSPREVVHALSSDVEVLPFDPEVMTETEYDVWHLQPKLFVVDSFEQLEEGFRAWVRDRLG